MRNSLGLGHCINGTAAFPENDATSSHKLETKQQLKKFSYPDLHQNLINSSWPHTQPVHLVRCPAHKQKNNNLKKKPSVHIR